ncbi:carbohydrate ABC transporter permease [Streptantibioticus cattleyicolor]|uniref:Binding-protein-dependent transport systems inner membrane component n=1 Tax=Streptantibioticus cattleyicolor (strain ATCC 35852 / DSM 46488 / JCM 4925 / NBRC 14057 / NRRL 8057) TaxID=1003195 RepID=F8JMM2_STREN|nr:sugar ABC transporter permease [Streptantibioticus cattleyicolor]AEW98911.1 binding-protein-dependent transport systems inner membrane component [Streptantibioticus cattleyicolor NRRL 8057 = DSM 46488]CCB72042.1 Carbohydrate ABC transporter membrane protein 1, CUT1 family [Streptantibioticus cattleyicolor NRRL 8057 = DSM 46488]
MRYHRWYTPWLLVVPALVWLAVFGLWPALNTGVLSFTNVRTLTGGRFTGLANYLAIWHDPQVYDAVLNTVLYMVVCVPLLTVVPLLLALLVERNLPFIGFFRTVFYFPVVASAVVVAVIWQWLLDDRGLVNGLAQQAGLVHHAIPFLTGRWLLLGSAIALTVWKGLGYYMIVYLSALGNVSRDLYEAAAVDGAGPLRRLVSVTVPGVRRTMVLVSVLVAVSAMRVFTELYILGGSTGGVGGQDVSLVMLIQNSAAGADGRLGHASALSVLLFLITLAPMLLLARLNRKADA